MKLALRESCRHWRAERGSFSHIKTKTGARRWSIHVRFCFFFAHGAVPITPDDAAHRAVEQLKPQLFEKRMEWRNWRLRGKGKPSGAFKPQRSCGKDGWPRHDKPGDHLTQLSSAMADPVFAEALAEGICFSGATWLNSSNLVARTEYHSRLVLSALILRFFRKMVHRRDFSAFSIILPKKSLCFGRKPTCFLLHFKVVLAIIITKDFVGRFSFLSTPCSWGCRSRQFKTVLPQKAAIQSGFQSSLVKKR